MPSPFAVRIFYRCLSSTTTRSSSSSSSSGDPTTLPGIYYLAHMNYARLKAPLDHPTMAEFNAAIDPVNALAKATPGYVWSLDHVLDTDISNVRVLRDDPLLMPQLSLWEHHEAIQHFAFKSGHAMYDKRRREWFTTPLPTPPWAVCWWFLASDEVPVPSLEEAFVRLEHLRHTGHETEHAFDLSSAKKYPKPILQ